MPILSDLMIIKSKSGKVVAGMVAYAAFAVTAITVLPNLIYPPEKIPFNPALAQRAAASALMSYQIKGNRTDCSIDGRSGFNATAFSASSSVSVCLAKPQYNGSGFNNLMNNVGFDTVASIMISYPARFTVRTGDRKAVSVNGYVADVGGKRFGIFVANDAGTIYYIPKKDTDCWKNPFASATRG